MEKKKGYCHFHDPVIHCTRDVIFMVENFKNPEIIGVIRNVSAEKSVFHDRNSHALIYKINGESVYSFGGEEVHVGAGTVLYVPQGASYVVRKVSPGESRYCLVNFTMEPGNFQPRLFAPPSGEPVLHSIRQIEHSLRFGGVAREAESLAAFYQLLALLIRVEQKPYTTDDQKHKIDPAIRYLEEHLFDGALKVSELPVLCGLSAPSFRRIFMSRFGTTPKKYLQQQRLQAAKLMLEGGEYADIGAVAQAVGFEDPLHFSKCFKAFCGAPPSKIK